MKEQSHKDEMSAALRGDFERLRDRGVPSTLAPAAKAAPTPEVGEPDEREPEPESVVADDPGDEPARRGWRARFFG